METIEFLKSVLGWHGQYCVFAANAAGYKKQKFYPTIDAMANAAQALDSDDYDVYFGLATFGDAGKRTAVNAVEMGALFLDLDCGPTKEYPDAGTALTALRGFTTDMGLPRPIMVSSGYGVHVYWPLETPVPIAEWKPVALALKQACAAHGLMIDTDVTADAARVLRVPGTRNRKRGGSAPVEIIGRPAYTPKPLAHYAAALGSRAPLPAPASTGLDGVLMTIADDPVMQRLMRNRDSSFRRIVERTMNGTGCAQIREAIEDVATTSEPLWRAALSITKFCVDGAKAAHRVSQGHPGYDYDATEAKLAGIKGPYTCATFDDGNPGVCGTCPLKGRITSPIQLGAVVEEAEVETTDADDTDAGEPTVVYATSAGAIPRFPFPYFRGKTGGVYVRQKNDDGDTEDVLVYMYDFYYTGRVVDHELGECILGRLHMPNDGVREFAIPLYVATSKEEIRKHLSKHGLAVASKRWEYIMAYTQAWIENLQTTTAADTARTQFGWTDDAMTSYALGDREIFADRVGYNPPSAKTSFLFPALRKKGTLEGWVEQAKFYDRPGLEPYQFVICQALAAPLMRLTPVHAAIFDFYSDGSGHGKSTTQKFALTIYGDPGDLMVGPKDTLNARMNRMELMKDVNLQFDEFTEFPVEHTSDLIYGITDGRQKARMAAGSNEERHRGEPWHTTVTASSNHSMLAKVYTVKSNPRAEVQRVLRYHVQPHNFTDKTETDVFAKSVGAHHGHAVEVFVQHLLRDTATAREMLDTVQRRLDKACGLTMQNRFWSVQGAVTITALILAREAGLLSYDPAKLFAWVVDLINTNKRADAEAVASIESIITDFVTEHFGNILWIKSTETQRGTNDNGLDALVVPEVQPRSQLVARYETDTKQLYLILSPFKAWCAKRRFNYDSVAKEATQKFNGRKQKVRISRGTKMNLPPAIVLILDCGSLDLPEDGDGGTET
jgi:hypothetical protein